MYVCICNAVTEKDIHKAVNQGVSSPQMLSELLSIATQCGCCSEHADRVLEEAFYEQKTVNCSGEEKISL